MTNLLSPAPYGRFAEQVALIDKWYAVDGETTVPIGMAIEMAQCIREQQAALKAARHPLADDARSFSTHRALVAQMDAVLTKYEVKP